MICLSPSGSVTLADAREAEGTHIVPLLWLLRVIQSSTTRDKSRVVRSKLPRPQGKVPCGLMTSIFKSFVYIFRTFVYINKTFVLIFRSSVFTFPAVMWKFMPDLLRLYGGHEKTPPPMVVGGGVLLV